MSDLLDRLTAALADRYAIERELGRGGMAVVYLAEDLKHHRPVALKVLRPELAAALGPERFLREIEIAAQLHHPHILPLYDSGRIGGSADRRVDESGEPPTAQPPDRPTGEFLFYTMPFVEGESLRDRLAREKQLAIDDALQIAREVADALSYAHSRGVIHRDIKPENILLESGHAVVADFGIARAVTEAGGERLTETGIAVGTPAYMSPEQAAGEKALDGRSDLYSLGCVLHEMLAGQPPFTGPSVEVLVRQHLMAPPPSVTAIRPSVPGWVATALERSLAKTPADRFNPVAQFGEAITPRGAVTPTDVRAQPVPMGRRWLVKSVLAVGVVIVAAAVLSRVLAPGSLTITTSNIRHVTSEPGLEFQPAISPDGSEVAYIVGPIESPRLVVRSAIDVGVGTGTRLAQEVSGLHWLPTWTPDGASVRFMTCRPGSDTRTWASECEWKEVGKLGGSARNIGVHRVADPVTWSRDGTRAATAIHDSIFTHTEETGELALAGVHAGALPLHSLAWSPDGRRIAYVNGNYLWRNSLNVMSTAIWVLDLDGGRPIQVTSEQHMNLSPQWLPDSRHLLFVSDRDGPRGIYVIEVGSDGPRGPPRSVLPASDPHSISVSADGRRLAYAKFPWKQNIWAIPIPSAGVVSIREAVPVTQGNQAIESHGLSPRGDSIVYESTTRGNADIYRQPAIGGRATRLVDLPSSAFSPQWSPDGSEIAFYSGEFFVNTAIHVVDAAGGVPRPITSGSADSDPVWSPDGLTIAYLVWMEDPEHVTNVWTVSRDRGGGEWHAPIQLTDFVCGRPLLWDPDGTSVWCGTPDSAGTWMDLVRVSRSGDVLTRHGGLPLGSSNRFSPDGSRMYIYGLHRDGSRGVWWIPPHGGDPTKVVAFDDPRLTPLWGLSVGEEHLYLTVAEYESDIWVMDLEW